MIESSLSHPVVTTLPLATLSRVMVTPVPPIAVFTPIRNEVAHIENTVGALLNGLARGAIEHLVFVLDGPEDGTPDALARLLEIPSETLRGRRRTLTPRAGVLLLVHPEPRGKGRAFVEGMCTLHGRTSHFDDPKNIVVNLDADVLHDHVERVVTLAGELHERDLPMLLGTVDEHRWHDETTIDRAAPCSVGFRALRTAALAPLFRYDQLWVETLPARFGLDHALNRLIYPDASPPTSPVAVLQSPPHRHTGLRDQLADRFIVDERLAGTDLRENFTASNDAAGYAFSERMAAFRRTDLKGVGS